MDSNSYLYTALHGDDIRYLTLHAFDDSVGVVQCSLHHASLHTLDGQFTALSYAWGAANVTEAIHLSGHPFNVTTNLAACLRQLATNPKYQEITLWVDAICINQHDVDERNTQVQRMGDIYSLAESVISWLGPGTELSNLAMQRLQNIDPLEIESLAYSTKKEDQERRSVIFDVLFQNYGEEGLRDLLSRPYWSRTWIVQEIRLAKKVHVVCGNDEVTVGKMTAIIVFLWRFILETIPNATRSRRSLGLLDFFANTGAFGTLGSMSFAPRIVSYLHGFEKHKCSDPRDKVYALLGITTGHVVERIIPDYDRPVAKVYRDVVETHIRSHDDLGFLRFACYGDKSDPDGASWIPDWRTPATRTFDFFTDPYYASKRLTLSSHPWSLDRQTERLHLTGVCLDTITTLSGLFQFDSSDLFNSEGITDVAVECLQLVYQTLTQRPFKAESFTAFSKGGDERSYALDDSESLADACRRTLVIDYDRMYATKLGCDSAVSPFMFLLPGENEHQRSDGSSYAHADTFTLCASSLDCRKLAITSKGWIGLVPAGTEVGDYVSVLVGASMPVILRKHPVDDLSSQQKGDIDTRPAREEFLNVGCAYIHGLMYGKGLDLAELRNITLR
ncbi:HET-domain-containing protein [Apiospora marii]|uniref:HET-domain-containing protein n=1 Tax=Apiospora marii TaxID=335849 RepID=UPI00313012F1